MVRRFGSPSSRSRDLGPATNTGAAARLTRSAVVSAPRLPSGAPAATSGLWPDMPAAVSPRSPAQAAALVALQRAARYYSGRALATSTTVTYSVGQRRFLSFMADQGLEDYITDGNPQHIVLFITHLAPQVQFQTVRQYLRHVVALYRRLRLPDPSAHPLVVEVLAGIRRHHGLAQPHRKQPIEPWMLERWADLLRIETQDAGLALFTAQLIGFFGFLRKSNLAVGAADIPGAPMYLRRQDVRVDLTNYCLWVSLRWSKTNQLQERVVEVAIAGLPGSLLDPVQRWRDLVRRVPAPPDAHAFAFPANGRLVPLTYTCFVSAVKRLAGLIGLDPARFAGHSFRRGGATFAFRAGVSGELIQLQGDWRSDAYLAYLELSPMHRLQVSRAMQAAIARLGRRQRRAVAAGGARLSGRSRSRPH